ncbi:hypothetical protein B0A55_12523 [Friedmanniomyces simplex]|uniref:CDAN1-interacting nuclease 1 n=1 Tax=Friedmanniomyces simplex TaxID=329884 RepID=A0A4U0WPW7_9PEZI|nr:hypothetical protein B0A55_12523 [Friedmanniomyces simplex]
MEAALGKGICMGLGRGLKESYWEKLMGKSGPRIDRVVQQIRNTDATRVQQLDRQYSTYLCYRTVSAILEAALRLVPVDRGPEGTLQRQQKAAERARRAKDAELAFISLLISIDTKFLREDEQKERIVASIKAGDTDIIRVTPDVLFTQPTNVCGFTCHWIEYKDTFGFRGEPFVAARNKKQIRNVITFGSKEFTVYEKLK